jgi:hypothetical protein
MHACLTQESASTGLWCFMTSIDAGVQKQTQLLTKQGLLQPIMEGYLAGPLWAVSPLGYQQPLYLPITSPLDCPEI